MSQWARSNPEEMERISRLPLREQNEEMRAAIAPLIECVGCGHPIHVVYGCHSSALFTREARCGCDSNYGDLPPKWGGDAA